VNRSNMAGCHALVLCHAKRGHSSWPPLTRKFLCLAERCGPKEDGVFSLEERALASDELAVAWRIMSYNMFYSEGRGNFCRIVQQGPKPAGSSKTSVGTGMSRVANT
jgi:hypothetical protein